MNCSFGLVGAMWLRQLVLFYLALQCVVSKYIPMFEPLSEEMVQYINHKADTTWKAKHSERFKTVSDIRRMLGTIPDPNGYSLPKMFHSVGCDEPELPEEFDARKQWPDCPTISEIRDQANCGSCWAFGAVEAMSDRICIASKGKYKPKLSAENLVACCPTCGMGCHGGFPPQAWSYWKRYGLVTGDLYNTTDGCQPYSFPPCEHHVKGTRPPCKGDAKTPTCHHNCQSKYPKPYEKDLWRGEHVFSIHSDEKQIMTEMMTNGPLEVDFEVYADFPSYSSGVYQHKAGGLLGGHAVRLLGWGVENGVKYWLIANSWNTDWGDEGYFKILRGSNECGIESDVNGGTPKLP